MIVSVFVDLWVFHLLIIIHRREVIKHTYHSVFLQLPGVLCLHLTLCLVIHSNYIYIYDNLFSVIIKFTSLSSCLHIKDHVHNMYNYCIHTYNILSDSKPELMELANFCK